MENSDKVKLYTNLDKTDPLLTSLKLKSLPPKTWARMQDNNLASDSYYMYFAQCNFHDFDEKIVSEDTFKIVKKYKNAYLVINNILEGYAWKLFGKIHKLVLEHRIQNKVIFASGLADVTVEYERWCEQHGVDKTFKVYYNSNWYSRILENVYDFDLNFTEEKSKWFCCLNNRPHPHRLQLVTYMDYLNLLDKGMVSCLDKHYEANNDLRYWDMLGYDQHSRKEELNNILDLQSATTANKLPLNIDTIDFANGSRPHDWNPNIYNKCLINVVTETYYYEIHNKFSHMFITEKTWKPIVAKQIFIMVGPRFMLEYLHHLGFKTFSNWIDESYDSLTSHERLFAAADALKEATENYTLEELNQLTLETRLYNLEHFKKGIKQLNPSMKNLLCL